MYPQLKCVHFPVLKIMVENKNEGLVQTVQFDE